MHVNVQATEQMIEKPKKPRRSLVAGEARRDRFPRTRKVCFNHSIIQSFNRSIIQSFNRSIIPSANHSLSNSTHISNVKLICLNEH